MSDPMRDRLADIFMRKVWGDLEPEMRQRGIGFARSMGDAEPLVRSLVEFYLKAAKEGALTGFLAGMAMHYDVMAELLAAELARKP